MSYHVRLASSPSAIDKSFSSYRSPDGSVGMLGRGKYRFLLLAPASAVACARPSAPYDPLAMANLLSEPSVPVNAGAGVTALSFG